MCIFANMEPTKTSYPKEKIRILFLENISDTAVKNFSKHGYVKVEKITKALSEEDLIREIKDVHILGIRSKTQITSKVLDAAKKLQAIGCFCIGVNQVDLHSATQHGVAVFNAPYSNTRSVAELVIGASIMLIRRIPDKNMAAHKGIWMKVLFYDTETKLPLGNASGAKNLKELVSNADIVSLHIPETAQTKNIINKALLKSFKKGSILINYARGEVVDLKALAVA